MMQKYDWDYRKAARNLRLKGISFDFAEKLLNTGLGYPIEEQFRNGEWRSNVIVPVAAGLLVSSSLPWRTRMMTVAVEKRNPQVMKKQSSRASSQREMPRKKSAPSSSKVTHLLNGVKLTKAEQEMVERLRMLPQSKINFEDHPKVTKNTFKNESGMAGLFKPIKKQITLRLDGDIIAWARQDGTGYQSRINAALRKAMLNDRLAGPTAPSR